MAETTKDMDTLREELSCQYSEIERKIGENSVRVGKNKKEARYTKGADASSLEVHSIDEYNPVRASEPGARLLAIDRETFELCNKLTSLVATGDSEIPQSTLHGIYSLFRALSLERKNINLRRMKTKQQKKALQSQIELLNKHIKSMEQTLNGMESKLEAFDNPREDSAGITPKIMEEYSNSRQLLHEVIDMLYPNDDDRMKNLLKDLTIGRFSGDGKEWVDVSKHYMRHVGSLSDHYLIETNPEEFCSARFCI